MIRPRIGNQIISITPISKYSIQKFIASKTKENNNHVHQAFEKIQNNLYTISWKDLNDSSRIRISHEEFSRRGLIDTAGCTSYSWPLSSCSNQNTNADTQIIPFSLLVKDLLISSGLVYSDNNTLDPVPPNDISITEEYDHSLWKAKG